MFQNFLYIEDIFDVQTSMGGCKGRLELFRKFKRFGDAVCPLTQLPLLGS